MLFSKFMELFVFLHKIDAVETKGALIFCHFLQCCALSDEFWHISMQLRVLVTVAG